MLHLCSKTLKIRPRVQFSRGRLCACKCFNTSESGGEGGIRTLGTGVSPYNGLANRRIRPLCHLSGLGCTAYVCATTTGLHSLGIAADLAIRLGRRVSLRPRASNASELAWILHYSDGIRPAESKRTLRSQSVATVCAHRNLAHSHFAGQLEPCIRQLIN